MSNLLNKSINSLIAEDFVRASALFNLGVKFFEYSEETLEEVCLKHGLKADMVIKSLELINNDRPITKIQLKSYPIDLLVEYLKHSHYLFVKKRLPYIAQLIDGIGEVDFRYKALSQDLKSIFPLFVEDFIHHIYEEEDNLFLYIQKLGQFIKGDFPVSDVYYLMEKISVKDFALEHEVHENEMDGFRRFTNDYKYCDEADLHIKVLYAELERFEEDLMVHAKIEDEILFPKALHLERQAKLKFYDLSKLN